MEQRKREPVDEEWIACPSYQNLAVSDSGQVKTISTGKIRKPTPHPTLGYLRISARKNGESKYSTPYVHRLVAEAFLGSCPDGMEVCHNDGDKSNNSIRNLRYDTHLSNTREREEHKGRHGDWSKCRLKHSLRIKANCLPIRESGKMTPECRSCSSAKYKSKLEVRSGRPPLTDEQFKEWADSRYHDILQAALAA